MPANALLDCTEPTTLGPPSSRYYFLGPVFSPFACPILREKDKAKSARGVVSTCQFVILPSGPTIMKRILHTLIVVVPLCVASPVVGEVPRLEVEAAKLGIPYHRYTTKDLHGRTITFYLSATPGNTATKLPVVLIIEGSGCQSAFQKHGNWVGGGFQNLL